MDPVRAWKTQGKPDGYLQWNIGLGYQTLPADEGVNLRCNKRDQGGTRMQESSIAHQSEGAGNRRPPAALGGRSTSRGHMVDARTGISAEQSTAPRKVVGASLFPTSEPDPLSALHSSLKAHQQIRYSPPGDNKMRENSTAPPDDVATN